MANQINWFQAGIDLLQAIMSGVFVGLVIYWLDERRAKRDRRLSDFRVASNWSNTEPRISLRNFDLSQSNLSGYGFLKANLERATLSDVSMWATNFSEANLRHTDFRRSRIVGAKFVGAIARAANFSKALMRTSKSHKSPPDFTGADLQGGIFIGARLDGVIMAKTNLTFADFSRAVVLNCDFTDADLSGSSWSKVKRVENCIWKHTKVDTPEGLPKYLWEEIQKQNTVPARRKKIEK